MKVAIKYFSIYRDALGKNEEVLDIPEHTSVKEVFDRVCSFSQKEKFLDITRFAINGEFSNLDTLLKEGDEVAFIPPVAGG